MNQQLAIERSIIKTYRKDIWQKFVKAINDYKLIEEGDKIAVCISGGKDSFLMAKCFQEIEKHGQFHFEIKFIVMDPGYSAQNLTLIQENAKTLGVPIQIFRSDIFEVVHHLDKGNPCYLCARMRRGYLYQFAQDLGCNKIALAHHFDDVIETTLLSMLYGGEIKTMMPKLHSDHFDGLELIRPMYLIHEKSIINWVKSNHLIFLNCACRFTEANEKYGEETSKRMEMKRLISSFREQNPYIVQNIFKSIENINLNCVISYHKNGKRTHFLDDYDLKN
ncbi:MAG: tRNA 2-thiocytidine biosynthesis protein TtcA [Bacilli bacterium]|jgi:tRNA 2-thiocytidine biosynthesis protein TtcA|nr:tRNA 2-thiocytidine biosynthesis protein TtcA [Bacilli bacterium]